MKRASIVLFALLSLAPARARSDDALPPAVPPEALRAILQVASAAKSRDYDKLRAKMVDDFTWSFGGDRSADQAIAEWKRDPRQLQRMEHLLRHSCKPEGKTVVCAGDSATGLRAGFARTPAGWRMLYFVEGD